MTAGMLRISGHEITPKIPRISAATAVPSMRRGADAPRARVGCPHFGHAVARSDISVPQFAQNAIARLPHDGKRSVSRVINAMRLEVVRLDPELPLPSYQRVGDAGLDLYAAQDATIPPEARVVVGTGIAVAVPEGYAGFVTPRSGLAARLGLSVVNTPGIVDSGYRGEIKVTLINHDTVDVIEVARGDRIGQML